MPKAATAAKPVIAAKPAKEPKIVAPFSAGDFVVYPAHGVGKVTSIESQLIAGQKVELFVISFERDRMTLRVPVRKVENSGLRKLSTRKVMETALKEHHLKTQPAQWDLLQNILAEAEHSLRDPVAYEPTPKRLSRPHPRGGLTIRREWLPNGWRLVFTGEEAKGMMIDSVLKDIERMYGPP